MELERVLERIGTHEEIVINKNFFNCGRMKENDLVCLSLLVSREHCLFTKLSDGLYVTDLGSSNGIYINGTLQRKKRQILLQEGDLIGIGCGELNNLDDSMFVYKVKNRVVLHNDCDSSTSDNLCNDRHTRKELSKNRRNESNNNDAPANKMPRKANGMNADDDNNHDDDIEIIECSNLFGTDNGKSCEMKKKDEPVKQILECAHISGITRQELNGCTNNKDSAGTTEPKVTLVTETGKPTNHSVQQDIIDITGPGASKIIEDDDIMEINLTPPKINVKREHVHIELSNKVPGDFDDFEALVNVKKEPETDPEPSISTTVKTETDWGTFSQIDIVEINDDEDCMFPSSQLFDKTVVKDEVDEEENDNNDHQSSLFYDKEDDNIVTILDSDEDDDLIISGDNTIYPIQKIKIEPGLEPTLEFVDVSKTSCHSELNKTDNQCHSNINIINNDDQVDSTAMLIASLTTDQSIEEQLLAIHKEPHHQPESASTSKDPLINKETCLTNDISTEKSPENTSAINDKSISNDKNSKEPKKKGLEMCEPHFIKTNKKTERSSKKDDKKTKHKSKSEHKSDKTRRHSTGSLKDSSPIKDREKSSKDKDRKKDKVSSKNSSKKSSHSKESSTNDKSPKDKHRSISSKSGSNEKAIEPVQNKNDENRNKNQSVTDILNSSRPKNKTTIVKAKVSTKTRGDMLCEAMLNSKPKPRKDVKSKATDQGKQKSAPKPDIISTFVIPRRQVPSCSVSSTTSMSMVSQLNTPPPVSGIRRAQCTSTEHLLNDDMDISPSSASPVADETRSSSPVTLQAQSTTIHNTESAVSSSSSNLKSALKSSKMNTPKKNVAFKENIAAVREFPIQEGNLMRNIKDVNNLQSGKKDFIGYRTTELKIEDFLARVFAWEPVWLEQQQKIKELPPIVKKEDMKQIPNVFTSFDQYYKRMEVLLLLETWQYLVKEYECAGNRYTTSAVLPCSIVRHSIRQMATPNKLRYSMMVIHTLVSKNQLRLQEHPVYGDMIILEYTIKHGDALQMRRAFAYVVQVQQQNSVRYLRSNQNLSKWVKNPDALLTYVVHTKMIDEQIVQYEQIARLRSIFYIRSHLRLIQGLQYIPHSELCDSILNVDIEQFQLEPVTPKQIEKYSLVTQEKLNAKQMEAVIKFTKASVRMEPKICLLVGPPGTGKSKVIANLVTQILYGNGRYVNGRPLRILVCAPSNAAIDEIVLRLLEIRSAITEHRFKMVRIGRMESMHEEVKKISVTELAKRDAQKTMSDHLHKNIEGVEQKKHKLKTDIDALELLVAGNPKHGGYKLDLENLKMKYKKLTNRRPEEDAAELSKLENAAKMVILQKANIIACTLTSCYTGHMESIFGGNSEHKIATCIVDEATQCCEAETLIPLMLGVKSLILVGDPNQLPATVMSTDAKRFGLDKSLFTRTKEALQSQINIDIKIRKDPIIMLNMQYRMVQAISHWPNRYFYGGKLEDMVDYKNAFPFQSYRILNLDGLQDNIKFQNTSEAAFVGSLINSLMTCSKVNSWNRKITVGVITPYQNQKSVILNTIREQSRNVPEHLKNKFSFEVNTIDSFQGQERDIIIMSLVRSSGIGFLSDPQRLCVALTRAKFTLIICGNFTTFQRDSMWKDLLRDARARGIVAQLSATAKPNEIKPHIVRLD